MSNDNYTVYLAGPVADVDDSGSGWRNSLKEDENGLDSWDFIDPLDKYDPRDSQQPTAEEIVESDLDSVDDADGVLVRYSGEATWGTPMEVRYAFEHGIPVSVAWLADSQVSPWVEYHASTVRSTVSRALGALHVTLDEPIERHTPQLFTAADDLSPYDAQADVEDAYGGTGDDDNDVRSLEIARGEELEKLGSLFGVERKTAESDSKLRSRIQAAYDEISREGECNVVEADEPENDELPSGDELASRVADDVSALLTDSRDTHGDAVENQQHIADGVEWYLDGQGKLADDATINGSDVARIMQLVKTSRTAVGEFDIDHDRDVVGYAAISGACAVDRGDAELDDLQEFVDGDD